MKVNIKKLHEDAQIPKYQTSGASGFDLHALEDITILPGETKLIRTGLAFSVGHGYEMQIRPRSGLSLRTPLRIANSPATIDSDFSGEVCVIISNSAAPRTLDGKTLDNWSDSFTIKKGDRIAQGVICPVVRADFAVVDELEETSRGSGGFGHTGI